MSDLTKEQLDGMDMWDRDVILDKRHRAAGALLVRMATAEIRRHRATQREAALALDRARRQADERSAENAWLNTALEFVAAERDALRAMEKRLEAWAVELETVRDGEGVGKFIAAELRNRMKGA